MILKKSHVLQVHFETKKYFDHVPREIRTFSLFKKNQ